MFITLARVCHMYYNLGLTQQQIAKRLHISRIKVSRLLRQARDSGAVTVQIRYDGYFPELEVQLAALYPGVNVVVTDALDGSLASLTTTLGAASADYLSRTLRPGEVVAVGWGRTLQATAEHMDAELAGTTFTPLLGGPMSSELAIHSNAIAALMAERTGAKAVALFAPAIVESAAARRSLLKSVAVRNPLSMALHASTCVFSVGAPFSSSSLVENVDYYTAADIASLREAGAACDVFAIAYYNGHGERVAQEITDRTVSLTIRQLQRIPRRVCVGGHQSRHTAIKVALDLGLATDLVTDEATARYLIEQGGAVTKKAPANA